MEKVWFITGCSSGFGEAHGFLLDAAELERLDDKIDSLKKLREFSAQTARICDFTLGSDVFFVLFPCKIRWLDKEVWFSRKNILYSFFITNFKIYFDLRSIK